LANDEVIVVGGEGWNGGVVGIVAARLLEKLYRPVIVLSLDSSGGLAKGSARSIPGYDMYEALTSCSDLLDHFGGHQAAAGMTLPIEAIAPFRSRLCAFARQCLTAEDYTPMLQADLHCGPEEICLELIEQLD